MGDSQPFQIVDSNGVYRGEWNADGNIIVPGKIYTQSNFQIGLPNDDGNGNYLIQSRGWIDYTTPGTTAGIPWPVGINGFQLIMVSGGGGGGSGRRGAAGTVRGGGGGGAAGSLVFATFMSPFLVDFNGTYSVTVGDGGAGGAGIVVDNTDGNPGSPGLDSVFTSGTFSMKVGNGATTGGGAGGTAGAAAGGVALGVNTVAGGAADAAGGGRCGRADKLPVGPRLRGRWGGNDCR
jgi:hypothetical protein